MPEMKILAKRVTYGLAIQLHKRILDVNGHVGQCCLQVSGIMLDKRLLVFVFLLGISTLSFSPIRAEIVEYTSGHGDIGLALEAPGQLFLHYHFGVGSAILDGIPATAANEELEPAEAYVRVSDANIITLPDPVDFLGTAAGAQVWVLPPVNTAGVPFLGIATEELDPMQFTSAGLRLTGMTGPVGGEIAFFQTSLSGASVFMRSNDGINPAIDVIPSLVGGHDHYNFAFTKAGVYHLDIEGFAIGPGISLTDSGTFRFAVGTATAVPEPNSLLLLAACGFLVAPRRRTHR
jgi:surface-anchored protein